MAPRAHYRTVQTNWVLGGNQQGDIVHGNLSGEELFQTLSMILARSSRRLSLSASPPPEAVGGTSLRTR